MSKKQKTKGLRKESITFDKILVIILGIFLLNKGYFSPGSRGMAPGNTRAWKSGNSREYRDRDFPRGGTIHFHFYFAPCAGFNRRNLASPGSFLLYQGVSGFARACFMALTGLLALPASIFTRFLLAALTKNSESKNKQRGPFGTPKSYILAKFRPFTPKNKEICA